MGNNNEDQWFKCAEDVNALAEKSTPVYNVPVSNTKIYQWRVAINGLYKQFNRTCLSSEAWQFVFIYPVLMFQVQIFGSFKTGLYLPTRSVIFQCKFCTKDSLLSLYLCSDLFDLLISVTCVYTCYIKKVLSY